MSTEYDNTIDTTSFVRDVCMYLGIRNVLDMLELFRQFLAICLVFREVSILGRKRFSDACYMELSKGILCGMQVSVSS